MTQIESVTEQHRHLKQANIKDMDSILSGSLGVMTTVEEFIFYNENMHVRYFPD